MFILRQKTLQYTRLSSNYVIPLCVCLTQSQGLKILCSSSSGFVCTANTGWEYTIGNRIKFSNECAWFMLCIQFSFTDH